MLYDNAVSVGRTLNFTQGVCCQLSMVTRLEQWSKEKVCTVIHFLQARYVSAAESHLQLVKVYGEEVMHWQSVAKWSSDLKSDQVGTIDNEKSGRLMTASTSENNACAEAAILGNK